jgi:hypothetical protein
MTRKSVPRAAGRASLGGMTAGPSEVDTGAPEPAAWPSEDWRRRYVWNGERWASTSYQQGRTALMVLAILVGMVLLAVAVLAAVFGPVIVAIYDAFG